MSFFTTKFVVLLMTGICCCQLSAQCPTSANTKSNGKDCLRFSFVSTPSPDPPTIPGYINLTGSGGGIYEYRATTQNNCNGGSWVGYTGTFTVNGTSCTYNSGVLPINLVSWDVEQVKESCQLNWKTSSEINNEYFSIERSNDGNNFISIGILTASNIENKLNHYSFTDKKPLQGLNYYQLIQYNFDGTSLGSDIIVIEYLVDLATKITAYSDRLKINYKGIILKLEVFSLDGQLVISYADLDHQEYDTAFIRDGYYIARLTTETEVSSQKLYIE